MLRRARAGIFYLSSLRHVIRARLHTMMWLTHAIFGRRRASGSIRRPACSKHCTRSISFLRSRPPRIVRAPSHYDLVSGQLNADKLGEKYRTVFLAPPRAPPASGQGSTRAARPGQFAPCACCNQSAGYGQSSVQDHQTKGDQPFQAILGSQLRIQPPGPQNQSASHRCATQGAYLLGLAAGCGAARRYAAKLFAAGCRAALLPLGYEILRQDEAFSKTLVLDHAYLGVLSLHISWACV